MSAGKAIGSIITIATLMLFCVALLCPPAHASVGVVLNESLNESMDRITGTGHTAVYFSKICPESPVKLRLCRPGEMGSVISTYINIGEDQAFSWNIAPLNIYLYGVEDPANRPIFGSYKVKHALEERYRENYLAGYCENAACRSSYKAEWREMVAATLIRGVYIFQVDTTEEQDRQIIAKFNDSANKANFNGITRNCADFTRGIINIYFPHAVKADYINDFGMTSPKAVARTFTKYALHHPDLHFRVLHFPQVPGTIKRSSEVRAGTEQLYRSKKLLVPMLIFADHELPFVAGSYLLLGRFSPEHTFEKYPAAGVDASVAEVSPEREELLGTSAQWKDYHREMKSILQENQAIVDQGEFAHFFKHIDAQATAFMNADGSAWMELTENGEPLRIGVSASNALAQDSNLELACKLLLARTATLLKSARHRRETMPQFQQDWANLQRALAEMAAVSPRPEPPAKSSGTMALRSVGAE
jgi:hypothetical protein